MYCVDNDFTSFVAVLLLLAMVYNEFCYIICGKQLVMYIESVIDIGYFSNECTIVQNPRTVACSCLNTCSDAHIEVLATVTVTNTCKILCR